MPFVVDASVVATWLLPDESDPVADAAYARLTTDPAIVPAHWWFELRNVLLVAERRRRISPAALDSYLAVLGQMPIGSRGDPDEGSILRLARTHRLSVYDAAYLDLARTEGLPLSTLDRSLVAAAKVEAVALIAVDV